MDHNLVFVTPFRTAVGRASCGVPHKVSAWHCGRGQSPSPQHTFIVLPVTDRLFRLCGSERRDEQFTCTPRPPTPPPPNPHTLSQTPSTGLRHPSFNHCLFSYAIGSRKLSTNEQFFVGAQTVESLLQTTQMKQGVSFIASNKVCTSANKTTIVWIETELFFFFRHLPPNSATEGALFISAQLSSDAVSALRKVRVLIWL